MIKVNNDEKRFSTEKHHDYDSQSNYRIEDLIYLNTVHEN